MAEIKITKKSYASDLLHFYFAPHLRSIGTIFYLVVFGYFTIYYLDNVLLAARFLLYVLFGHTALSGTVFLFTGLFFIISLVIPFAMSFYSILVLHEIWRNSTWSKYVKGLVTAIVIAGGILIIIISSESARMAARQDSMQSFVEDANLSGRI